MFNRAFHPGRVAVVALVAVGVILTLTSCTGSSPVTSPSSPSAPRSAPSTSEASDAPSSGAGAASSSQTAPAFDADATTPDALATFTAVVKKRLETDPQPHGRDVIDALVAAGFDKKAMQLTPDTTTLDRSVDSIEFSVLWKKRDCLVGQVGGSGFSSVSAPVLGTGTCLIGSTRSIDW